MDLDRAALRRMLILEEGMRLKLYRDSKGLNTIGVGRNLDANGVSREEALLMLENDISDVIEDLNRVMPWWHDLVEPRQRVLADMRFNMGMRSLSLFKQTLALVRAGDYEQAADHMMHTPWADQVGPRAVKLVGMMRTGLDP